MPLIHNPNIPPEPGSRQKPLIALQIFFSATALLVYSLRVYTRASILRSIGSDDYIMGLAVILSLALSINACISTTYGWSQHISSIPFSNFGSILFTIWLSELLFTIATSLAKISILFFYLRLAVTRTYRRVIWGSVAFITIWGVTFSAVVIFQCTPIPQYWNPVGTTCHNPEAALFIHGLTNTLTDVYIYVLPMKMVWEIKLPKRQRVGLVLVFGTGFLVCISGILRLYYSILTQLSPDTPWEGFYLWTWESVEINLGIVCASAPCLKALFGRWMPRLLGGSLGSRGGVEGGGRGRSGNGQGRSIGLGYLESGRGDRERERGESEDELTGRREGGECVLVAKMDVHQSWLKD